jgi:hypothetical protein
LRRLIPIGIVGIVALTALAVPASASFDRHFSVITDTISSHATADGFRFEDQLFAPFNRNDQIGRDQGGCRVKRVKLRCNVKVHLNGEVGGEGFLYLRGNLGGRDSRLNVTGGTDDFDGAAGKAVLTGPNENHVRIDLTR